MSTVSLGPTMPMLTVELTRNRPWRSRKGVALRSQSGTTMPWPAAPQLIFSNGTTVGFALSSDSMLAMPAAALTAAQVDAIIDSGSAIISLIDPGSGVPWAHGRYSVHYGAGTGGTGNISTSGESVVIIADRIEVISGGGGGGLTQSQVEEVARDAVGAALVAGAGIGIVVDDPGDTITISSTGGGGASTWDAITGKPTTFPPTAHNHDDRYYTEAEVDALLASVPGGGSSGPLAEFAGLPSSPVEWQPYEYRYTDATTWPGSIVWASGQPATVGWGVATLVWDGTRWCGEWTTMHGTNLGGGGTSYAPIVILQTATKTQLTVTQPFTTSDPESDPVTVTVDWGDGTTPAIVTSPATHTYELNGTYTAWFTPNDGFQDGAPVSASYAVAAGDTTAPIPGTLAVSDATAEGFTLTVSGASDAGTGLHAAPYRYSTNDGAAYTDWQAGPYVATGLLPGAGYTAKHQTRDAVGNIATGAAITATTTGTATTLAEAMVALGAVGFWKFDETTGTTITDYSGNAHHGSLTGTAGTDYVLAGYDGKLTIPNGVGRVVVPDADDFTITNGMTWFGINRLASSKTARMMRKDGEWLVNETGTRIEAGAQASNLAWVNYGQTPDLALEVNKWKAWAVSISAATTGVVPKFYLNSATPQTFGTSGTATYGGNRTGSVELGGLWGAYSHYAIFPRQLTDAEVQQLMDLSLSEGLRAP